MNNKKTIIYASIHHQNTEKIALVIGEEMGANVFNINNFNIEEIKDSKVVGLGSGIYYSKFHQKIIDIASLPFMKGKDVFIFSTSGVRSNIITNRGHKHIKNILKEKGVNLIGEFECRGFDTYGPLKMIGGMNKGKPDEKDIENAKEFARKLA